MYKLMIADDEPVVLNGIANTIHWEQYGIQVVGKAKNGTELIKQALELQPDIILTDIRMPEFDGLSAIEKLKGYLRDCEFLIITAYEEFDYAKKAIELGVAGYITKPVLKSEIIEQVLNCQKRIQERCAKEDAKKTPEGSNKAIERAVRYMRSHVDQGIMLMDVADYLHMNSSYFSRYFKEEMKISFSDFVKNMKIERAKELLDMSNMKTYEISNQLGYSSVQYFSTVFKNVTGKTPQEYRGKKNGDTISR